MKKSTSSTFLLELPLQVNSKQAKHLQGHFEAARNLYNALLGEAMKRLNRMRADSRYSMARTLAKSPERNALFSLLRKDYGFSEYALHAYATHANTTWIAEHLDANTAQTLATRAYHAANKVCLKQARKVRFKSKGRGLDSLEGKTNKQGIRFVLQQPEEGNLGLLVWGKDRLIALINWNDPVVCHGLQHRIKYVRLIRRRASSPKAKGTDTQGYRYFAQLILEGKPYQKPKHTVGIDTVGLDIGPSTIAVVSQNGSAQLDTFCPEIVTDAKAKRRLERKLERQRCANNPHNYDAKGRVKKGCLVWRTSKGYQATRRRLANTERKLAAYRKSLHGKLVHEIIKTGNTIITEKLSYKAWQKQYGKSIRLRAPGMFMSLLKRTVANTGGTLHEVSTRKTRLSQYVMAARRTPRSRFHNVGISARVVLVLRNAICIARVLQHILNSKLLSPLLTLKHGSVWRRACRQQERPSNNVQMTGRSCPEAWVFPVPERVCLRVLKAPCKSWSIIVVD